MINSFQIGVIGSMLDRSQQLLAKKQARIIGQEIALRKCTLLFGFEPDHDSLSFIAARQCAVNNGLVVAFLPANSPHCPLNNAVNINSGQIRGGGREFSLVLSCDALICMAGGSGTLMEIAMAYQANIPVIALTTIEGWSKKLASTYLDNRQRQIIIPAQNGKLAVDHALACLTKASTRRPSTAILK